MILMMYEGECIKNVELVKLYKHYIQLEKITARTLLLLMLLYWIYVTMNDSDEVWRWVHQKYVIIPIVQKLHSTGKYICSYLAVANDIWLNWCKNELEWWIMKLSASKICNYSNCTKVSSNQINNCSYLAVTMFFDWVNKKLMKGMKYEGDCIKKLEWVKSY